MEGRLLQMLLEARERIDNVLKELPEYSPEWEDVNGAWCELEVVIGKYSI